MTITDHEIFDAQYLLSRISMAKRDARQAIHPDVEAYFNSNVSKLEDNFLTLFKEPIAELLNGTGVFTSQKSFHS